MPKISSEELDYVIYAMVNLALLYLDRPVMMDGMGCIKFLKKAKKLMQRKKKWREKILEVDVFIQEAKKKYARS